MESHDGSDVGVVSDGSWAPLLLVARTKMTDARTHGVSRGHCISCVDFGPFSLHLDRAAGLDGCRIVQMCFIHVKTLWVGIWSLVFFVSARCFDIEHRAALGKRASYWGVGWLYNIQYNYRLTGCSSILVVLGFSICLGYRNCWTRREAGDAILSRPSRAWSVMA